MLNKIIRLTKRGILLCLAVVWALSNTVNAQEEKITIKFMHFYGDTDTDISAKYMKKILENEFEEKFPNVNLVQEIYDNQTYKSKIKVLMAADEEPDIMFGYGGGFSELFVKSGKILQLDEYLDDFYKGHMNMELQKNFIYDDQLYGICFSSWKGVLYCNKSLFDQINAEIPETYEELLEVAKKFRDAGIEPIACGMLNQWQGQQWINNFTIQLGGTELYKKMANGVVSMNQPALCQAAQLTADLISANVFCSNMKKLSSDEAEEMFLSGDAAMIYIGSWYTTVAEERLGENLEVALMPAVQENQESGDYHGGGSNGLMVSSKTKYPELAAEIVAWLGYRLSCYQPANATFSIESDDEVGKISEISQKIIALYKDKNNGGEAWDTLMKSDAAEEWLSVCGRLFDGKLSGADFVKELDRRLK